MTWLLFFELLAKSSVIAGAGLGLSTLLHARAASDRAVVLRTAVCLLLALPLFLLVGPSLPLAWLAPPPTEAAATDLFWSVDLKPVARATLQGALPAGPPWTLIAALAYSGGLLLITGRLVLGVWTLNRWTGEGYPVTHRIWTEALRRLDASGRIRLIASPRINAPLSWGPPPGVVLISQDCIARPETASSVLAHELAHIRRRDWLFLLLSRLAVAVFWFNPLAWVLHAALSARTEDAADADAVAQVDPRSYALALIDLASHPAPVAPLRAASVQAALGIGGSHKSLTRRIARIMKTPRRLPSRPLTLALSIGALAAVATPLAAVELIARAPLAAQAADSATAANWTSVPPAPPVPPVPPAPPAAGPALSALPAPPTPPAPPAPPVHSDRNGYYYFESHSDADPESLRAAEAARAQAADVRAHAVQARAQAAEARAQASHARVLATRVRAQAEVARRDAERVRREHAAMAPARADLEAQVAQARAQAALAQEHARHARVQARASMRDGADEMDRGADQMRAEAVKLRDPAYRAQIIADNRARGNEVTDAELVALSRRLPGQADDMVRQAQRMREQAAHAL